MELYLSACSKAANVAATKTATSSLATDSQQCGDLFRPSYDFNLTDPYCRLLGNQYKSLHDPHLRSYYKRKDILRRLKKGGYVTSNNKIVCTLRELNKYRQYLTSLKLDFERNYLREQEMIARQLHKLQENRKMDVTQFQNWLLKEGAQSIKDQEQLIRHRYLDMISKELEQLERTAEEQHLLRMDREERRQREYTRKKLNLRRKIEEEWKTKEMLLLTRIGEDVKREQRIEEQRRKSREESDRKKQALLEKKMAYHLQKMQDTGFKEDVGKNTFESRGQDGTLCESSPQKKKKSLDDIKVVYANGEQTGSKEAHGAINMSNQESVVSTQTSPTKNNPKISQSVLSPQKEEKEANGDYNEKPGKRSSYLCETAPQTQATASAAQGIFSSPVYSNTKQNLLQNCLQEKVTSDELNSIIQNVMTWVVATVTSILYPAITKYEERLQNNTCPVPDDSDLSSDSSSFCSTCSEEFTYGSYTSATTKMFQAEPCTFTGDTPVKRPVTPSKPPSAHVERKAVGKTHQNKGQSITSHRKYNKANFIYSYPKLRSCKSDSHLLASLETGRRKSKDATTETDSLETPLICDKKTKAMDAMKNLKNVFVNFKCHLKGETEMILESIFQEIMSDLTQAIPSLSSVTAEVFVDHDETEKEDLLSNVDICSVASEIVENMLEKLESAVEKKCVEMFSQEDLSVDIKPSLSTSGEYFTSLNGKPSEDSLCHSLEPMCDIAEDMVHAILEKLLALASYKKKESPLEDETCTGFHRAGKKKSSPEANVTANLIVKEKIQNLISNIFSQSSLVGYIEEAISTILGYVQTELNSERLTASEETVILLQLLDDMFTQLHSEPVKAVSQKSRQPRPKYPSDTEEKYRLTGTRISSGPRSRRPFPPVNVPGMVLYSEDDNEEIDNIVKNVLDSSFKDEKAKSQEQIPNHGFTKGNINFEYKRKNKSPTKPASGSQGTFHEWGLKVELPSLNNEDILKEKAFLNKDISIFSQDQKHQIIKASENMVKCILTEMLKDISSVSLGHLGSKFGKTLSVFVSEESERLSHQESMDQMFSVSEISAVALEITDAVLNILHKASIYIPSTSTSSISSDTPNIVKEAPNKKPLNVWFDSEKKMKYLSSLDAEPAKPFWLRSEENEPQCVGDITDKIINTVFKRLKLFVCRKLQMNLKPALAKKSSLQSQLSTYTTKIVNIVLQAIQNELEFNKKNLSLRETDHTKPLMSKEMFADSDKKSLVTNLSDDFMESPLLTCICEMLSNENEDQRNISVPSDKLRSATLHGSDNVNKQSILPSRQDKKSFYKYLATPCMVHSIIDEKDLKENSNLQVLDRIGETLHEMLSKLTGSHSDSQPSCTQQIKDKTNKDHSMTATPQSNIPLISKTILEYILEKLCSVNMDTNFTSSGFKAVSESLDIDNLSFASIIDEMAKCTKIISSIISNLKQGNKEVTKSKAKNFAPVSSKTKASIEMHPNKLKAVASDILTMVFDKLEGFANGNLDTPGVAHDENKKDNRTDWECESSSTFTDTPEESLQSALYMNAKKVSSAILKAIQTELNVNSSGLRTSEKNSPPETQRFTNIVDLILDAVSSDMFNETEDRGMEAYRYRPTYGNFLPGGAESDSFREDDTHTKEEFIRERTSPTEETKTHRPKQWVLERTLNKIEVKLKEPHKSPIVPIIRNILNEIFRSPLVNQLNVLSLSHPHFSGMPYNAHESTAEPSAQFMDKMMGPLVSETDVNIVANDVVRTIFHKLLSAAMIEKNVSENRCETITFSANVSVHEHSYGRNSSVTLLNRNPCTLQSGFHIDRQTKVNVGEDIVQEILTNLETFATSKVNSLFCSKVNFTVPVTLPIQQDESTLSKTLSAKDSYSDEQFSCYSVDHMKSGSTNSLCHLSLSRLNIYAKEVATKVLQGIKHELDKERDSPFVAHNIVVSESIASQVVNTVLDIVSYKSNYEKNNPYRENDSDQQDSIIEKLFNKTEYQKILQFQIQDTIENILCDIYEKILYQNNLSLATHTVKCSTSGKHLETKSEIFTEGANKIIPKLSVPKSDVILLSRDTVAIVLHNLSSVVMLVINSKFPASTRLPFCDTFPKAECPQSLFMGSKSEGKTESFLYSRNKKSPYADDQIVIEEEEEPKKSAPDINEENAQFITEAVYDRLQSFATERIDSLITLASKEKSFVSPELENRKQDDSIFHDSRQGGSDVNILKISTTKTILSQGLTESTFASYREKLGSTIHLSQASLKDYADIIANAILKLIKNDLEIEIQKTHPYPNNILFQKNIIVNETVNSILNILSNKKSVKEISFPSKENHNCSQLTVSNEIFLGHEEKEKEEKEKNTTPSVTNSPLEQKQVTLEKESQRIILEEIFMRKGESKQKEKTELLIMLEELLNKLFRRIMEVMVHLPPLNEIPLFSSNLTIKASDIAQKNSFQAHINSVANDIVQSVLGEMYSVVITSIHKSNESSEETETPDNNSTSPMKAVSFREIKQARKRRNLPRYEIPQKYPYTDIQNASVLENTFLQYSPMQVRKDLVRMVLNKITNFVSFHLEESLSPEAYTDELQLLRSHNSKVSPKDSPKLGFKANLKARSKITSLSKLKTKPHLGPSGGKTKSKTKLVTGAKNTKDSRSKTAIGLPHILSTGDAKSVLKTKLPTLELKVYAKDIITNILETIMNELEKVTQRRAMENRKDLPSDEIMEARKIVDTVLQELYTTSNHNYLGELSHLDDYKLSQQNLGIGSFAKEQTCFYLDNVPSQLEQIFPKDGIFKKMFDKWQTETNDMENEKIKLLILAENVLTEISIKAKDLEYSLSLLNLPLLEDCESGFSNYFKGSSTRPEDTKAQITIFGREIVEMLFEKLQLCFLSQIPTPDSQETLTEKKDHVTAKSKHGFPTKHTLSTLPTYNVKTKDKISMGSSNQIVQDIVERVLNILESYVDIQFKHISKFEFSEIVKMPIENLSQVQQRLLSKKTLPKLQPLKKFSDETKSNSIISKENIQNTFLQVHSFHSELFTYAVNIVIDMLSIIKNKLDKEISQMEPSLISILEENTVASEIISTLIDQCSHFSESLIKNLPMKDSCQGTENVYIVNQVELASNVKMPTSKFKEACLGHSAPQRNVPDMVCYSEEDVQKKYRVSSNSHSCVSSYVKDTIKTSESIECSDSKIMPSCLRNKVQDQSPRKPNFGHCNETMNGNNTLPEGTVLQKLFKKANDSTEEGLKQAMSFIGMGKGENPKVFHYKTLKPVVEPNEIQTTVSPLKICLAAEHIVNTVLSSYGFPHQPHTNESMESMKPFFISQQSPLSEIAERQKNTDKSLLRTWCKKVSYLPEEEKKNPEPFRKDCSLLQKWQKRNSTIKIETLKELEVIAFADHELGPNEIHLVARHVTTSVVTHLKDFKSRVSTVEKISLVSTLSRKNYESKHLLRSIYNNSSIYQFCEQLTESVICHLNSSISDGTKVCREKEKAWEIQDAAFNTIVSVHSQVFEGRSISIGELALSISEVIILILSSGNIIETENAQQIVSRKTKYIYCPGITSSDIDDFFQDLLSGVIHVMSKEIGINHHFGNNGRNKSFPTLRRNSVYICNKTNTMESQTGPQDQNSSIHQIDHLVQKNKLNYLAYRLDSLIGSLKTHESKEVVNKVFNIVLDLFLPDEFSHRDMDSSKIPRTFFSSSNNQQSNRILRNSLGLSPKSVFLLNVVCEKLTRILLEKCTGTLFLEEGPSNEIPAEEYELLKILQHVEDGDFSYHSSMDCEQLQEDYMSDLLENLAEMDQDSLSSDCILTIISHSLVKSLMDKLSHSLSSAPESPHFENKYLKYRTREIKSSFTKAKRPDFIELGQGKGSLGSMSCDSNSLTRSLNNSSVASFKIQVPLGKQCAVKSSSLSPLVRQETKERDTIPNKLFQRGMSTSVYSATFLEEIISELFFNLSISLWGKNAKITEVQINEMNTLFVNDVVNEFNKAQVTVLRNAEESLCFPPIHKETVSKIVDSVYYDVLEQYELKVTCCNNLAYDNTSIVKQISNSILAEILDYQLPSNMRKKLRPHSYYPLEAEIILQKLQNNLRKFISQPRSSKGYSTMLPHSFLEDVIRRLLSQLIPLSIKPSSLENKYLMSSDFNEMSTCIINKVMSAISKHKIWFTIYDNYYLCTGKNLQKMVDSVYSNILQMSDSVVSIQKSIISRSPIIIDRITSFVIQEIIENHLQPFLCGEALPRPKTPLDAVSIMVKEVLSEVIDTNRPQKPIPVGVYPDTFVGEIVARLLSKIFSTKPQSEVELENMTQKIVNSVNNHFNKANIRIFEDKEQSFSSIDTDVVDELVTSVYRNVLEQHGLNPGIDKEPENSDFFVENITKLIVVAISNYLLHPLFSGDLSPSFYSNSIAENIVGDLLSNISTSIKLSQSLPPYNTLLPYTFLEDMIRVLLSRFFPSASSIVPNRETPKDKSIVNFNEIASNLISDIRKKISQHEIRISKDEEETKFVYSEDDVQHLVDSVFKNILQHSASQQSVEQNITSSDEAFIDRIAGFIIKHICEQHLQPFLDRKSLSSSSYTCVDDERQQFSYASVYSSTFLEDVVSGVLSRIFHRVVGIVQMKSVRNSEDELFDKAENLIHLITEEFSRAQVTVIDNAEERLHLPLVERDVVKNIIDTVYSKVLEEYEMEIMPDKDFLNDSKTLAMRVTKIILAEIFDFQIHPDLLANLPPKSYSKLSEIVLTNRAQYDISKSRFRRQASTTYTTLLSHFHLEKIVTQLISQISPLSSSAEHPDTPQSDLNNTVIKLINEIMSIISKHAICITKHGNGKQSMISEKDIQSMVDSIYADLSHSDLYQSLTKDKTGIKSIPVSKMASFIIKEIFNHHLQSFLYGDKTLLSASVVQTNKQKATDTKKRELSFIVNSAVFLEEVISELLCKILHAFTDSHVLSDENPDTPKAEITDIVTKLVKSIILEFTTSEILVADNLDEDLCLSEEYKEVVQKTVNSVYEKILDEYKSLVNIYRALQSDTTCFGGKMYHFLLEEIYDYQVQSLISGELMPSSYSSPRADNIIRNVLNFILKDSNALPSCITVFPHSLLEDMIYKLLVHIFPSNGIANEVNEETVTPDDEFMDAASKLTDEIIKEIFEHEIRLATAEENAESMQLEAIENFIDSVCNNIMKKSEFQAAVKKDANKKRSSFLSKIAGFIMKEIMDHHLRPFLFGEESSSVNLPDYGHAFVVAKSGKEKIQPSLFSATFLEDVIVDLVYKFCSFPTVTEDSKKKEMPETDIVGLAIKFANSLIGEFRKSDIKVLPHAEEIFSFPPIDKETVEKISNFVYDQFIGKVKSNDIQKDDKSNIVIEMISALAQKAISAFRIQPLFSGDWFSTFFSFLKPDNITQRVQRLPQKPSMQITRSLKGKQLILPEQSYKHTSLSWDQKNTMGSLETDKQSMGKKRSFNTKDTSMKKSDIQDPIFTSINTIMKTNMINLISGSAAGVANKKKEGENKPETSTKKYENVSNVSYTTTSVKSMETQEQDLSETLKSNEIEKEKSAPSEQGQVDDEIYKHFSVATIDTEYEKEMFESDSEIDNEENIDNSSTSLIKRNDKIIQLSSLKPNTRNMGTTTEKTLKIIEKPSNKKRRDRQTQVDMAEEQYSDYECVQNVIENIYDNVLIISSSQSEVSKRRYSKSSLGDKSLNTIHELSKDSTQSVTTSDLSSINEVPAKKKEKEEKEREREKMNEKERKGEKEHEKKKGKEKVRNKEIKSKPSKVDHPEKPSESKPRIFPAKFLEDVIIEMVNKLIFSSSPKTDICDKCSDVHNVQNQGELYDTAMKLIDSLLKEFSDAQIRVFRPDKETEYLSHSSKESEVHEILPRYKEPTTNEASSSIKMKIMDKMPHTHKATKKASADKILSIDKVPEIDKTLVNKIVHSSICNILKECSSQESICENVNSNGENLARSLTTSVINEIFQHQLNLMFCDEVPASACLPLESKDVVKQVQKVAQTASKECQTSSPYTIMLPYKFLEDAVSALLSKIFPTIPNTNTTSKTSEDNLYTELEFLQMKLVSTVAAEISKDEDMIIQYVESLHPNDDEIIQLVVQSIYNNLLPQFGSQEIIQNCVISGCRLLSETIIDLVLREVAGNQLQNYFCGELTPHQCAEVDTIVENILRDVILTTPPPPAHAHKLSCNIIEEVAVKFLSKLLSTFPRVRKGRTKSLEPEMKTITSKILNSFQEFISKSKIKLVQPAKESSTVPLADNETIEKVVNSVYTSVLKHSGSHTSIFKDLLGNSNALSDIIGFLMVKEISNSEFQPQVEEEVSNSELVLEAVKILEKVVKIIDELKSQEKSSPRKCSASDAQVVEEASALFLAKLPKLPSAASKDAKILSKPELGKIASQLTKSVSAEISRSNISLVASDPEEHPLNTENIELVSQPGALKDLYDTRGSHIAFPKKVASLIVDGISSVPLYQANSDNAYGDLFGDLDINRIVEKAQNHVEKITSDTDKEQSDEDVYEEIPVKIVPHVGSKPIKIDPNIIAEHLAVISVKTQPLEKLKMECLKRTGHSIAELRRASISGRSYSSVSSDLQGRMKERRTSLDRTGRLDLKPCEAVCRNSFPNIRKPDITKIELLKDVQNKKDLIIRLVAHDIHQVSVTNSGEELVSDEEEIILGEVVAQDGLRKPTEAELEEVMKPPESKIVSPKPTISTKSLRKILSLSNCCQSGSNIENTEAATNKTVESKATLVKRAIAELDMASSKSLAEASASCQEKKSKSKKEERSLISEPTHYFIHRIMSSSSYNQEDLISSASEAEDFKPEPSAKVLEESFQEQNPENSSSVKFVTIFDGSKNVVASAHPSKEITSETPKISISKQGSKMLAKVSSTLSKVFSRSNANTPKSS